MHVFSNKRLALAIALVVAVVVALAGFAGGAASLSQRSITVGFIYDNDARTPYSYDFFLAQRALQEAYPDQVQVVMYDNILDDELADPVEHLALDGCDIIFTNTYGNVREFARCYPEIQFCQVSNSPYPSDEALPNYHTFKGEAYQARYVSGVVAGLKLQDMIDKGRIQPDEAVVGFVAAFPTSEVISGYSAFILGVRSIVPQATMRVKYTDEWSAYTLEKACAKELIEEGCVIISQHTDTVGPAIACEECYEHVAFHVGYNIDMTDVAPDTSLTSVRLDWAPYVIGAVDAVMRGKPIEDTVAGRVHAGNDMSAGFEDGWVEITKLNEQLLPEGTQAQVDKTIAAIKDGSLQVFLGNYTGVNPADPNDVIDLRKGFVENESSSIPSFRYILTDVVVEEE